MSVMRREDSIRDLNSKENGMQALQTANTQLLAEITELQIAICEIYETMEAVKNGKNLSGARSKGN